VDSPAPSAAANGASSAEQSNNSVGLRRNPFGGLQNSSNAAVMTLSQLDRARSASDSVASPSPSTPAIKNEDVPKQTPAIAPTTTSSNYTSHLNHQQSSAPHTNGAGMAVQLGNTHSSNLTLPNGIHSTQPAYQTPNTSFESKWRQAGKGEYLYHHKFWG